MRNREIDLVALALPLAQPGSFEPPQLPSRDAGPDRLDSRRGMNAVLVLLVVIGVLLIALVAVARGRDISVDLRGFKIWTQPTSAARTMPGVFGLSDDRIEAELRLYDAILRLQTARKWDGVTVPNTLDERIGVFWRTPEEVGPLESDVDKLTAEVLTHVPDARRRKSP